MPWFLYVIVGAIFVSMLGTLYLFGNRYRPPYIARAGKFGMFCAGVALMVLGRRARGRLVYGAHVQRDDASEGATRGSGRMLRLTSRIRILVLDRLREKVLNQHWREQACRQEFFYNAFKALTFNGIDGDYAEFGCGSGMSFAMAYHESRRHGHQAKLWAFDSFQGLPASGDERDQHPMWQEGNMTTSLDRFHGNCALNGIPREAYKVVQGFYEHTLTARSPDAEPRNIALAYVDCDLYSSAKTALQFLEPRLKHGMIVAFDDYFCWSASQIAGERRAMLEVLAHHSRWALVPFFPFGWHGNSFVVEDRRIVG